MQRVNILLSEFTLTFDFGARGKIFAFRMYLNVFCHLVVCDAFYQTKAKICFHHKENI